MLVKIKANEAQRVDINHCVDVFRGQIVDVNVNTYTLQIVGSSDKLDAFIEAINYADILELVRSGVSGLARGEKTLKV